MMKLKFKLTLLLLTLCTLAHAEEYLVLYNSDGTKIEFALSTNPVITLQDGTLLVKSTATEFSIAIENVQKYVLYDNTTDINIIEESEAKCVSSQIESNGNSIVLIRRIITSSSLVSATTNPV